MTDEKKEITRETAPEENENIAEDSKDIDPVGMEPDDDDTVVLPMIPLRGLNVFPNMVLHFDIGREKSINAL